MKEIPLTKGKVALVDDEDYDDLARFSWRADGPKNNGLYYARRSWREGGKVKSELMHTRLTGWKMVDHKDHDSLNNQRSNLRETNHKNNGANRRSRSGSSRFKGVSRAGNRWRALIYVDYKQISLGTYGTQEEAAIAYNEAALYYFGEHAFLNDITEEPDDTATS